MQATYSPDDNKLRLYAVGRLDAETYARVKAHGFKWAPQQQLFVAPMWTPEREDLLLELAGEVGDEDTSLCERAEDRAERFEGYSANRAQDAESARQAVAAIADNIPFGQPILIGHHSERHARRDAEKIESGMRRAVKMWETSKYWTERAAGALAHAKYKERPDVRARRIKALEADLRKQQRGKEKADAELRMWECVDMPEKWKAREDGSKPTREQRARFVADRVWLTVYRNPENGCSYTASNVLQPDGERYAACPAWTVDQVLEVARRAHARIIQHCARWIAHYENRLAYERAMLAEDGGLTSDRAKFEVGGRVKRRGQWFVILRVNRESVSVSGHFASTITHDEIQEYEPPTEARAAAAKKAAKIPPLCNYPGEGFIHLTRAELEARNERKWSDFPKTLTLKATATHGAHRVQRAKKAPGDWSGTGVFVTDEKRKDPPPFVPNDGTSLAPEGSRFKTRAPEPEQKQSADFEAMKESLRAGVQVVSAPQLFPTPPDLAARMVELAEIPEGARVLEPSAGTGALLDALHKAGADDVLAVEINQKLAARLDATKAAVRCADFLQCNGNLRHFDRIVMNPPFENGADIRHIEHALSMLKEGGRLVAICANGPRQREKLMPRSSSWEELPEGTFAGTGVRAALLTIEG